MNHWLHSTLLIDSGWEHCVTVPHQQPVADWGVIDSIYWAQYNWCLASVRLFFYIGNITTAELLLSQGHSWTFTISRSQLFHFNFSILRRRKSSKLPLPKVNLSSTAELDRSNIWGEGGWTDLIGCQVDTRCSLASYQRATPIRLAYSCCWRSSCHRRELSSRVAGMPPGATRSSAVWRMVAVVAA